MIKFFAIIITIFLYGGAAAIMWEANTLVHRGIAGFLIGYVIIQIYEILYVWDRPKGRP